MFLQGKYNIQMHFAIKESLNYPFHYASQSHNLSMIYQDKQTIIKLETRLSYLFKTYRFFTV